VMPTVLRGANHHRKAGSPMASPGSARIIAHTRLVVPRMT
jgi:hypothetical protein